MRPMFVFRSRRSNLVRRLWKLHQSGQSEHGEQAGGRVSEERVTLNTNNNTDTRPSLL